MWQPRRSSEIPTVLGFFAMPDPKPDPERQRTGRLGGLTGWNNTPDRYERMAQVRENSPAGDTALFAKYGDHILWKL